MASIKTLQAFTAYVDDELQSFAYNTVYDVDSELASEFIDEGLAESYGGGGGGDFSIATMTISVGADNSLTVRGALAVEQGGVGASIAGDQYTESGTAEIILYKGMAVVELSTNDTIDVSGAIEFMNDSYVVTGDCTVTVSGGK